MRRVCHWSPLPDRGIIVHMRIRDFFISEFPREEFIRERWDYRAGDHVTFVAPTDYGKTTLAMQLIEVTASPKLPVFNFAGKPRDKTMKTFTERMGLRVVRHWPPPLTDVWKGKPSGWTIWPPHTGNEDIDDPLHAETFRRVIRERAKKGNCILHLDEFGEFKELGLDKTTRAVHRRGRSNGVGLWGGIQGPVYAETHAYSQAMHLFLGNTSDKRHRERFGEIGGSFDRRLIEDAVAALPDRWWLYICRRGKTMCLVGP